MAVIEGEIGRAIMAIHGWSPTSGGLVVINSAILAQHVPTVDVIGPPPLTPPVVSFVEVQFLSGLLDG